MQRILQIMSEASTRKEEGWSCGQQPHPIKSLITTETGTNQTGMKLRRHLMMCL